MAALYHALGTSRILEGLNPRRGLVARRMGIGCRAGRRLGTVLASRIGFPQLGQCGTLGLGRGASIACLVARNGVWSFDLDQAQHPQREIRTARLSAFYGRGLRLIATGTREAAPEGAFARNGGWPQ
jgi:hypothetical protein